MQAHIENDKINKALAHVRAAVKNYVFTKQNDIDWIFEKICNINHQAVATEYLQEMHTEWIGNTLLHFAADERLLEAFDVLLNCGADFTIKNSNGSTALHLIMQKLVNSASKLYKLSDPFVKSVLLMHLQTKNFENPVNQNGLSHFHIACATNNFKAVKEFFKNGIFVDHTIKIDSPYFPGFTSLHFAAKYCALEAVDLLLTHGVNVHIKDAKGMTPLHIALERKLKIIDDTNTNETLRDTNDKILQLLLNKQSNSDVVIIDDWGLSNFHVSCTLKDSKVAERLLQKVVNINDTVNTNSPLWAGYTALHFAALCNVDIVKLLAKNGADINIKDVKGVTPFDICIEKYQIEDISSIISLNPVCKNIKLSDGETKLSVLVFAMKDLILFNFNLFNMFLKIRKLSRKVNISNDSPLWPGCSPMHLVVIMAKKDAKVSEKSEQTNLFILRNLSQQNRSMLYSQDVHGHTPVHLAFRLNKKPSLNLMLETLEKYCSTICVDEDGLSFIHIAAAMNNINLLIKLLRMGANVNAVYRGHSQLSPPVFAGSTPLHFAVIHECAEAVDVLLKHGADVYIKDSNDMTPIHCTIFNKKNNIADRLVSLPNLKDSVASGIKLSHLHVACWCEGKLNVVKRLLDNGADVDAQITCPQNVNEASNLSSLLEPWLDYSPLMIAQKIDHHVIVKLLLQRRADIFVKSADNVVVVYDVLGSSGYNVVDFMKAVKTSDALMARIKAETGMNMLHLACFDLDDKLLKKSLSEGVKVNEQIRLDSPIMKGYTALHILVYFSEQHAYSEATEIIELLLNAGADVTLQNTKSETALHMVYDSLTDVTDDEDCNLMVNRLLQAHRDFSKNPTNIGGISHFHIACHVSNVRCVKKFLNHGEININQRIDYFYPKVGGYTPLQLAAGSVEDVCGILKQLDTVDLLLTHGADIRTENYYKDNPFHECIRDNSVDLFERLARNGGDVNAQNISGETPFYYYLKSKNVTLEGVKLLMRLGCRLNTFSAVTHKGYLSKTFQVLPYADVQKLFFILPVNFKQEFEVDNDGCTAIHNIVSTKFPKIHAKQYVELICQLSRQGCDIDDQDNLGRTALHIAVKFYNVEAIAGLLLAGADINIADNNNKTALAGDFNPCEQSEDEDEEDETTFKNLGTLETLATHIKKLQFCGIEVDKHIEDFPDKASNKIQNEITLSDEFFRELEMVKITRVESHSLTLYDFLSETGAVADYPTMSQIKRCDVKKVFTERVEELRDQFPLTAGLLQLQYRKARVRVKLAELARNALPILTGFRLPEICSEFILKLLRNSELKNLIESVSSTENAK